ncbi:MAG: molybdopterin-dependent oxidoreductase [Chloroflexi bacterium]|nr:molybdopterin-dependent oxidoreductase [Chloroflexota bacterium]
MPISLQQDEWVPTVCHMCQNACGVKAHVVDGTVVRIEGDADNPHNFGRICAKGNAALMGLYDPHRIGRPLKRTNPKKGLGVDPQWQEIEWEEALSTIAEKLKDIYEEDSRQLLIHSFDPQAYIPIGLCFTSAFGTPNFTAGAARYYCGNGFHPITYTTQGVFFSEPDVDVCNYMLLIGSQNGFVANTNPMGLTQKTADARLRGMKVVVVDPVCCNAAAKADEWIPIKPGTDAAFALGMLNVIVNELNVYDGEFLRKYTNAAYLIGTDGLYVRDEAGDKPLLWDMDLSAPVPYDQIDANRAALEGEFEVQGQKAKPAFQLLKEHLQKYPLERVAEITTIPAETIRRIAREFATAARVGSTVVIHGQELPYRPVSANWNRGPIAHKHAMHVGYAIQMLNIVVGAIDVPGGHMGVAVKGPDWEPSEGPDGLLVAAPVVTLTYGVYPPRKARRPQTLELMELMPVSVYGGPFVPATLLEPEKFGLDYRCKMMIQVRSNTVLSGFEPRRIAEAYANIPFVVSFATVVDETAELADIVLPDTHSLERLDPFPNRLTEFILAGESSWYYMLRQPVVKPYGQARHWIEVLLDLADRIGIQANLYQVANTLLRLKDGEKLDPRVKYAYAEIVDRALRSRFGDEHGLEWFKANGFITLPRSIQEAYPRPFVKGRIPLYLEYYIRAGQDVEKITKEMGIYWETDDYIPLPEWKPCESHESNPSYPLIATNFKVPFHTHSYTAENPWLEDVSFQSLWEPDSILINSKTAAAQNIANDDAVWLETERGHRVQGRAKVTECIHPEVVATIGLSGHWAKGMPIARGNGIHFNSLIPYDLKRMDFVSSALDACVRVRVLKASQVVAEAKGGP